MATFAHDNIVPDEASALSKKEQVAGMFDEIAPRYDFLNRFLSAGIDIGWRKKALKYLEGSKLDHVLDVATGTGDVALMSYKMLKPAKITGIDISDGMLAVGREKVKKMGLEHSIVLENGDSETIMYDDNTFDAVTVAFGVRNFQNLEKGLAEIKRVLVPGGRLVVLEFSQPKSTAIKWFYNFYMKIFAPGMCSIFSANRGAYEYLGKSIKKFPEGKNFTKILDQLKYQDVKLQALSFGICTIYYGQK